MPAYQFQTAKLQSDLAIWLDQILYTSNSILGWTLVGWLKSIRLRNIVGRLTHKPSNLQMSWRIYCREDHVRQPICPLPRPLLWLWPQHRSYLDWQILCICAWSRPNDLSLHGTSCPTFYPQQIVSSADDISSKDIIVDCMLLASYNTMQCDLRKLFAFNKFEWAEEVSNLFKVFAAAIAVYMQLLVPSFGMLIHQIQQFRVSFCPYCLHIFQAQNVLLIIRNRSSGIVDNSFQDCSYINPDFRRQNFYLLGKLWIHIITDISSWTEESEVWKERKNRMPESFALHNDDAKSLCLCWTGLERLIFCLEAQMWIVLPCQWNRLLDQILLPHRLLPWL